MTARKEAYEAFTKKIQECQQHGCQESVYELSCMADNVSPALGHVSSVWKMLEVVKRGK